MKFADLKGWQPQPLANPSPKSVISPAHALARWLVLVWERSGGEGNDLLRTALPGCPGLETPGNWPLTSDVDDVLRALVKMGWLEQTNWCPDTTMARYVFPGQPVDTRKTGATSFAEKAPDGSPISFYAAGCSYRPRTECAEYCAFVEQWRYLLQTLPRAGKLGPGDRVRLTTSFLASTGQSRTPEAKKTWAVKLCACRGCHGGSLVAVDESRVTEEHLKEYAADPEYQEYLRQHPWRHINEKNLRRL